MTDKSAREFVTGECRLAFPSLFEAKPRHKDDNRMVFSAVVLIPPTTSMKPFQDAMKAAMIERFGKVLKLPAKNNPIHDCAEKEDVDGYDEGWHFINLNTGFQPSVVDHRVQPILDPTKVYPGCLCKFHVTCYAWDNKVGGKGVSFSLNAVQKVGEGDRLDGRRDVSDVFEAVSLDGDTAPVGESEDMSELFD